MTAPTTGDAGDKAAILIEALPYIRRFRHSVVVVKYGGSTLVGPAGGGDQADPGLASFAQDIALLRAVGLRLVVVHGGGPQIGDMMRRLGKVPEFIDGLRVTDAETLDIARMVLVGKVNRDIVAALNVHGPLAVGVSGEDGRMLQVSARAPELGFVGDVDAVDPGILERLLAEDLVPVVATIGADQVGQSYNINADTAAGALAQALRAEKLVYLTDVEGIRRDLADPTTLLHRVSVDELDRLVVDGAVTEGMVPKVASCVAAVKGGVGHAHVLDGRVPHALLLEIFTEAGVGTMVTP